MRQAIAWIVQGGGGLVIAYWIIEHWDWAVALDPEPRQWVAWAISGTLGVGALGLSLWFGFQPIPATGQEWFQAIMVAAMLSIGGAKLKHTRAKLSRYTRNGDGERVEKSAGTPPWPVHPH
jgi:hypothetical protein